MKRLWISILTIFLVPVGLRAEGIGALTFRDGSLRVIRGASIFQSVEGMRMQPGDILESSDQGFAQVEFTNGTILVIGPATKALISAHGGRSEILLLQGWLKGECNAPQNSVRLTSSMIAVTTQGGTALIHSSSAGSEAYFESGPGTASAVTGSGDAAAPVPAKAGQMVSRRPGKGIVASPRPDNAFVQGMPTPFRDTLPSRLARFPKPIPPKNDHEVSYLEVEPWLRAPASWRHGFVERFRPRLKDMEFRNSIEAHLASYPEWDRVLHPEKYANATPATGEQGKVN